MMRNFSILLSICCIVACRASNKEFQVIQVSGTDPTEMTLNQIANTIEKVQLETRKESFIGNVSDILTFRDYILTIDKVAGVLVFDKTGRFLQIVGSKGDGPGQYASVIYHAAIDKEKGLIYLASGNKLLVFSDTFSFLKEKKFPFLIQYLFVNQGNLHALSKDLGKPHEDGIISTIQIFKLDPNLEIMDSVVFRKKISKKGTIAGYAFKHFYSDDLDGQYFYQPELTSEGFLRDTLYQMNEEKFLPFAKLAFDVPVSIDERGFQSVLLLNIFKSKSYIFAEFDVDFQRHIFLYNLNTKKGFTVKEGFTLESGKKVTLRPLDPSKDTYYYIEESEFQDAKTEEKNPIIGIVELKKNLVCCE